MRGTRAKQLRKIALGMTRAGHELTYRQNEGNSQQRLTYPMRRLYQALKGRRTTTDR